MKNHLLRAALDYAGLGLPVIPLKPRSKKPLLHSWRSLGTTDPDQIQAWWNERPNSNIGILTGSGLMVLDVDGQKGRNTLHDIQVEHGNLPPTATSRTGGGGQQLFFWVEGHVGNRVKFLSGLDIRADGGQVVAPPSIHPDGPTYDWLRHPADGIAEAPTWLLELIRTTSPSKRHPQKGTSFAFCDTERRPGGPSAARKKESQRKSTEVPVDQALAEHLFQDINKRFAITGYSQRNDRMHRAVASLLGKGHSEELTRVVMTRWLDHFKDKMRTHLDEAESLLDACIISALDSCTLLPARSAIDHDALCDQIVLTPFQTLFLSRAIVSSALPTPSCLHVCLHNGSFLYCHPLLIENEKEEGQKDAKQNCHPLLITNEKEGRQAEAKPLCRTSQERAFVEALIVQCFHKIVNTKETTIKMTNQQIKDIMQRRHGLDLDNQQMERLKARYVSRPGKPAKRCELLRETFKGRRTAHGGVPSEYKMVAIGWLLETEMEAGK